MATLLSDTEQQIKGIRRELDNWTGSASTLVGHQSNLAYWLKKRYLLKGAKKPDDLNEAIRLWRQVIVRLDSTDPPKFAAASAASAVYAAVSNNLGNSLGHLFGHTKDIADLEEAVQRCWSAVKAATSGDSELWRYERGRDNAQTNLDDERSLRETSEVKLSLRQTIASISEDEVQDRSSRLHELGNAFYERYAFTQDPEDLYRAVRLGRQTCQCTPATDSAFDARRLDLGYRLLLSYEHSGNTISLKEAVQIMKDVLQAIPLNAPDRVDILTNLGVGLNFFYERTGLINYLANTMVVTLQALKMTSEGHPGRPALLSNIADRLQAQYERTGKVEKLQEAIEKATRAVELTPESETGCRATRLNNLGNKLIREYERTGRLDRLDDAIETARQAKALLPYDHPDFTTTLTGLGYNLMRQFERTREGTVLEEAIGCARQAVKDTQEGHQERPGRLDILASMLGLRTPLHFPGRANLRNNLAASLGLRSQRSMNINDLEDTIQESRIAVRELQNRGLQNEHPELAPLLLNLGTSLAGLWEHSETKDRTHLEEAITVTRSAWQCQAATPFDRLRGAIKAIQLLQAVEQFESAYDLSVEAITFLPSISNQSLTQEDQQYIVAHFSGLAATACSLALHVGKSPGLALELLEQARGVIIGLLVDDRSGLAELKAVDPELYMQYEKLRLEVDRPSRSTRNTLGRQISTSRTGALAELEECFQKIQRLRGSRGLLHGLAATKMKACAASGSIIVVNATALRSDAIIITPDAITAIPLPKLTTEKAEYWIQQDLTTYPSLDEVGTKNKSWRAFLTWLWHACVRPVMLKRYPTQSSVEDLPRVWWIGTGLVSSFPFHAACKESGGVKESCCYRVLSSYTPTEKAMKYSRERAAAVIPSSAKPWRAYVASMPSTPGLNDLPGTTDESCSVKRVVEENLQSLFTIETKEHPDVAGAVVEIQKCNIARFACHGISDPLVPSRSGLVLQTSGTRTQAPRQDSLSVRDVFEIRLEHAEIAYLSACSTAENKVKPLADEVLHVVSGFQAAGFRHVVGCLWPSLDHVCKQVAESFYSALWRNGVESYNDRAVALALHKTVLEVREGEDHCLQPLVWAQYVHFGA
ncbi:CHAT domain-containing protein [Massariosphaeria phaeospora]|uniref:CHAT domain-containing protein n=1 Tax=Massariosphaeria phaeospora TaxID=100035 RepID=A0A7C8IB96_9PLEO|nr:CHAT domain-containing protein [Massariosphaeria phaeospora]